MKKTLLLTHEYAPFHGGVGRYCYELFKRLPEASYNVVSDQKEGAGSYFTNMRLLDPVRPRWLFGLFRVARIVRKGKFQMLVTPHILPLGSIALLLKKVMRLPYIISLHGFDLLTALKNKRSWTRAILKNADHIIVNSEATRHALPNDIATPVTVITPYGEPRAKAGSAIPAGLMDKQLVVTVGRLVKRKGQRIVIKAVSELVSTIPSLHYVIIGSGPDSAIIKNQIASDKLQESVTVITDADDALVGSYLAHASVFAMPTVRFGTDVEGFGIVFLEAARSGVPIVAGTSWAEKEALGEDGAEYVDGTSVEAVADAIRRLLEDDQLRERRIQSAREHVGALPSWDTQSNKLVALLQ